MYAESGDYIGFLNISNRNTLWKLIEIDSVQVSNGKVNIGFEVEGNANAECQIDDVTFVKITG